MPNKSRYAGTTTPLCECGCGAHVSLPTSQYLPGHFNRTQEWRDTVPLKLQRTKITYICEQCETGFIGRMRGKYVPRFCSRPCYIAYQHAKTTKPCALCRLFFRVELRYGGRYNARFCSQECRETYMRKRRRETPAGYTNYRQTAFEDHGARCVRCGYERFPAVLHVHHIDRNRRNNLPENLIVLCPTCHAEAHYLKRIGFILPV